MIQRLRSLFEPDAGEPVATPSAGEAVGVWVLGLAWALSCVWLGFLGSEWILPGLLLGGLLAVWGWRHIEWLWWFPAVLVVASLMEPLSPLYLRSRFGPLVYMDLLTFGVAVVAIARAIGLRRPLLPGSRLHWLALAIVAVCLVAPFTPAASPHPLADLKRLVVLLIVFYASSTVASRPRGSRWVWVAFPLASAIAGAHALWAILQEPPLLNAHATVANEVWGSRHGNINYLLVCLPVCAGLALNAGHERARQVWVMAFTLGAVGLVLHVGRGPGAIGADAWRMTWGFREGARMALAWVVMGTLAHQAWRLRVGRPHEAPRWLAVTLMFVAVGAFELAGSILSGPALPLLVVVAGLVDGTLRADRRTAAAAAEPASFARAA
jgi:hypothetical protein